MHENFFITRSDRRGFDAHLGACNWALEAMAVGGLVTAGSSLINGSNAAGDQRGLARDQARIAALQEARSQEMWDRYLEIYDPLERQIVDDAFEDPDYQGVTARAQGDVAAIYDGAVERFNDGLSKYGINPGSGRYASAMGQIETGRATSEVKAINEARRQEDDQTWARRIAALGLGKGLPQSSMGALSQAGAGYGAAATQFGNQANSWASDAGNAAYAAGRFWQMSRNPSQGGAIPTNNIAAGEFPSSTQAAAQNIDFGATYNP